jgi:hypothetical protein
MFSLEIKTIISVGIWRTRSSRGIDLLVKPGNPVD